MTCKVDGCNHKILVKKYELCQRHYHRFRSNGTTDLLTATKACEICGSTFLLAGFAAVICRYCSPKCRSLAHTKRASERAGNAAYQKRYKWAWKLRRMYGMTEREYEDLRDSQEGRCRICQRHESESGEILVVDHNHETGKYRALLCRNCNAALGGFNDNVELVMRAAEYLKAYGVVA